MEARRPQVRGHLGFIARPESKKKKKKNPKSRHI
jgi:hypothetical protein